MAAAGRTRLAGLDKPNIGLLSEAFLQDVRNMPSRNLAVELLEKLLRDEIKAHARNNVVQEKKYGERLQETLRKYHNRAVETAQVIEELIQMAKDFQSALERDAVRELGDDILKKIAVEIIEKLRDSTTMDWQVRESMRGEHKLPGEFRSSQNWLCKSRNTVVAEYALRDKTQPIGVAEYPLIESLPEELQTSLPSIEQIERELGGERE